MLIPTLHDCLLAGVLGSLLMACAAGGDSRAAPGERDGPDAAIVSPAPGRWLLRNVRIFDPAAGAMTHPQDIFIDGAHVWAVGDIDPTPGTATVDCAGRYALPGLFDCHTHVAHLTTQGDEELARMMRSFVEKGITQLRDVGGPLDLLQSLHGRIDDGDLPGPDLFYSGPMLEESPLTWAQINSSLPGFTVAVDSLATVDRLVPELVAGGARLAKTFNKFDRDVYAHLVATVRGAGLPVVHDPGPPLFHRIPIDVAIDCGARSIEHGKAPWPIVLKDSLAQEHDSLMLANAGSTERMAFVAKVAGLGPASVSPEKLEALYARMIAQQVYFCPTLHVFIAMAESEGEGGPDEQFPQMRTILKGMEEVSRYFTRQAAAQGVKVLVGQDGHSPEATFAEMRHLRDCGLSEAEIIKGATLYPAEFLGVTDSYGAIARGRVANIVIVDRDPLEAIENIESTFLVVHNGSLAYMAEGTAPR